MEVMVFKLSLRGEEHSQRRNVWAKSQEVGSAYLGRGWLRGRGTGGYGRGLWASVDARQGA